MRHLKENSSYCQMQLNLLNNFEKQPITFSHICY